MYIINTINKTIYLSIYLWLYSPLLDPGCFVSFSILYEVGRTPWTGNQHVARPLPTHRSTQTQNKRTQTSMPKVRFEPTVPVFERAKTVHALDQASTVIGPINKTIYNVNCLSFGGGSAYSALFKFFDSMRQPQAHAPRTIKTLNSRKQICTDLILLLQEISLIQQASFYRREVFLKLCKNSKMKPLFFHNDSHITSGVCSCVIFFIP
jgi:hypothetical protein